MNHKKMIPYGSDNLYPNKMDDIVRNSPTTKGCVNVKKEFIFGLGQEGGDFEVNKKGKTFNDILIKSVEDYAKFNGFALHFNVNGLGRIVEINNLDFRYTRKHYNSKDAFYGNIMRTSTMNGDLFIIPLYNPKNFRRTVRDAGGLSSFNGWIYYFQSNGNVYPEASHNASSTSGMFEDSVQSFNYSTIENSFSASGVVKVPQNVNGEDTTKNVKKQLKKMKGSDNAGSMIVIESPLGADGESKNSNIYESFTLPNIDNMFNNQVKNAKDSILREYRVPEILLGTPEQGMFNQTEYYEASNYYNNLTFGDRKAVERAFNKFWDNTVFPLQQIEITPLEMEQLNDTE
jgi:capsid portal protein